MRTALLSITVVLLSTSIVFSEQSSSEETQAQENREWLLARLHAAHGFSEEKFFEVEAKLKKMNPSQLRALREAAEIRMQEAKRVKKLQQEAVLNQATLNLQKAQAYRDHLKREFGIKLLQSFRETQLMRSNFGYGYRPGFYGRGIGTASPHITPGVTGGCVRTPTWQYHRGRWHYGY